MEETKSARPAWLITIIQIIAWIISVIGSLIDIFALREAYLALLAWYRAVQNQAFHEAGGLGVDIITGVRLTALDMFTWVLLCLTALVAIIAVEYYFRKGREKGLLFQRIGKVLGIEAGIVVVSILIRLIVIGVLRTM